VPSNLARANTNEVGSSASVPGWTGERMRVSDETIYRSLFIQEREFEKELMDHLRSKPIQRAWTTENGRTTKSER
jgi:IS30 family transposase